MNGSAGSPASAPPREAPSNPGLRAGALRLLALALLVATPGCAMMFYPLARAFGSPAESEFKVFREGYSRMQETLATGRVVVFPTWVLSGGATSWSVEAAAPAVAVLASGPAAGATPVVVRPEVADLELGRNQLRFLWSRARQYAAWVSATHPEGDYFVFTEVFVAPAGEAVGGQLYVIDAAGRVCFARVANSHHFDPATMAGPAPLVEWMTRRFVTDLAKPPLGVFPKWGVG